MNDQCAPSTIVCFGDSLTLGYQSPTWHSPIPENIPYGTYLQEWMGSPGHVLVCGVCGETTHDMRMRFQKDVLNHRPHVAIIIGGTNDLGLGISPAMIMENLRFFYEQTQSQGILPVAVTIPSLREDGWQNSETEARSPRSDFSLQMKHAIAQRVELNQFIKDFGEGRKIPVVDWFTETCESKSQALASEYSNDGLHLTTAGYRKLAEMAWEQVLKDMLEH